MAHHREAGPEMPPIEQIEAGHETRQLILRPLFIFVASMVIVLAVVMAILRAQFSLYETPPKFDPNPVPPLPRLARTKAEEPIIQKAPVLDLEELRAEETARLNAEGWVDRKAGVARISIDDAIKILAAKGLPARKGQIEDRPPGPKGSLPEVPRAKKEGP